MEYIFKFPINNLYEEYPSSSPLKKKRERNIVKD